MTNKKLKLAAMSVALTACVAAQPMAAHAVEGPDSVEDNAAPQAEPAPVEGKTAEGEVEGKEGKQEEFVPPENDEAKKDDQAPAFGPGTKTDDITIDYKPAEKPEEPGETDETENPDGTYVKGDVIDNSKKDEATGKDGKIGEATKTETVDPDASTTEVEMGKTTTHPDGSTTTPGTQTTTDQGSGEAKAETETETQETGDKEKDPEKGQIDLNEELGEDRSKLTWDGVDAEAGKDQEEKAKYNGYTIQESKPSEDGNSKELTLKKTETGEEKHLSAEDIAKLVVVYK